MTSTRGIWRAVLAIACLFLAACGIPREVWQTLASEPDFEVIRVGLLGPNEIPNGGVASYTVSVELVCRASGVVKVVRELWDSDFPPFDPDELLSWRRDDVLCQPPPNTTVDTQGLMLRCINGEVRGFATTDPDGRPNTPRSGEGSNPWPLVPGAEIYGHAHGSIGPARRSGEKRLVCVDG